MSFLLPWLATFFCASLIFAVGLRLQRVEKKKRLAGKQSTHAFGEGPPLAALSAQASPSILNELGAYSSQGKQEQEKTQYRN